MWRHQLGHYWGCPKNFRIGPFWIRLKNIYFNHFSGFSGSKYRALLHRFSKNPIRRSGNWQKVKNFRAGPFQEFSSNLSFLGLLSLNMEWLRGFLLFWCLSVDKSRATTNNIFQSLTVKIRKTKIENIRSKWYIKLKHLLHWLLKYCFGDQRIIEPEVLI